VAWKTAQGPEKMVLVGPSFNLGGPPPLSSPFLPPLSSPPLGPDFIQRGPGPLAPPLAPGLLENTGMVDPPRHKWSPIPVLTWLDVA